jgi:hypothetical protein
MRCRFVFLVFLGFSTSVFSADKTWVGGVSSNWFDGDNWSPPGVPESSHAVEITNFTTVVLTGNLSLASLELRRATLVVSNQLTVSNLWMSESSRINAWLVRPSPVVPPAPGNGTVEIPQGGRLQFGPSALGITPVSAGLEGTRLNLRGYGFCTNRGTVLLFFRSELNIYGTLEVTGEFNFDGANGPPPGSVRNFGTFLRSGGTNLSFLSVTLTNRGVIRVESGTMTVGSGANSGVMNISLNATQAFAGTPFGWEAGGTFTGAGTVYFVRGSFEPGTNNVAISHLLWAGTELSGTNTYVIDGTWLSGSARGAGELHVASGRSLAVRLSGGKDLYRRLVNFGKLSLSTNASISFPGSVASLINRGAIELGPGAALSAVEPAAPPPTKFVLNEWLLTSPEGATNQIWPRFTNANRFRIDGQVSLFHSVSVQSAGETTVNGTLVTPLSGPYYVRGGVLKGNGVVRGRVRNAAIVNPGESIGQLTVDGSLTNHGTIEIEFGVGLSGPVADKLVVTDHLRLGGRLRLLRFGDAWPDEGTSWEVLRFGSTSSNFYAMIGLDLGGGRVLQPVWSPTNLVLTLTQQPVEKYRLQTVTGRANDLELRFTVDPDSTWSLDASSNLVDWSSLLTTNTADGVLYFRDAMDLPLRFYRARQMP